MRLLIAMMKHETNTFSPVPTPLSRFRPLYGEAAIGAYRGTGTGIGAYLDLALRERAEIVLPIAAGAPPSSPVEDGAYAHITDTICEAVASGGFDGIMLDLHGAMVTESLEDGEGQLLKRLRAIDPKTPIAVSLDMHANLYDEIIANATVVTGYRTYPHIDTYETAKLAGEILLRAIRGEETGHGMGQCSDAATRNAAGHRRPSEQGLTAPLRCDGGGGGVGGEPLHRVSARRHNECGVERGRRQ